MCAYPCYPSAGTTTRRDHDARPVEATSSHTRETATVTRMSLLPHHASACCRRPLLPLRSSAFETQGCCRLSRCPEKISGVGCVGQFLIDLVKLYKWIKGGRACGVGSQPRRAGSSRGQRGLNSNCLSLRIKKALISEERVSGLILVPRVEGPSPKSGRERLLGGGTAERRWAEGRPRTRPLLKRRILPPF